jgi:hypothetical protein
MRIYKVNIEHSRFGRNFSSEKIAARTFAEVIRKARKILRSRERIESVELIAAVD